MLLCGHVGKQWEMLLFTKSSPRWQKLRKVRSTGASELRKKFHGLPQDSRTDHFMLPFYQFQYLSINATTCTELQKLFGLDVFNEVCMYWEKLLQAHNNRFLNILYDPISKIFFYNRQNFLRISTDLLTSNK